MRPFARLLALALLALPLAGCDVPPDPFSPHNLATGVWEMAAPSGPYQALSLQLTEDYAGVITGGWQGLRDGAGNVAGSLAGTRQGAVVTLTLSRQLSQIELDLQLGGDRLHGTLADESANLHAAEFRR